MQSPINQKDVTLRQMALQLGLSTATVSRALNGDPSVTAGTTKRVYDLAERLGYRGNEFAKLLRNGRSYTFGCIVPRIDDHLWSGMVSGMEAAARREGYSLVVMQSAESGELEADCAGLFYSKRIDGLLVISGRGLRDAGHFQPFHQKHVPVVLLDHGSTEYDFINLNIDHRAAGYELTRHLLFQGCKRIIFAAPDLSLPVYAQRYEGYRMALEEMGMSAKGQVFLECGLGIEEGIKAASAIYQAKKMPDAFIAAGDHCAIGCMAALQKKGILVPKEIAFASFGNDPVGRMADPQLTSMRYPCVQAGEIAVRLLLQYLCGEPGIKKGDAILLKSELVFCGSSQRVVIQ